MSYPKIIEYNLQTCLLLGGGGATSSNQIPTSHVASEATADPHSNASATININNHTLAEDAVDGISSSSNSQGLGGTPICHSVQSNLGGGTPMEGIEEGGTSNSNDSDNSVGNASAKGTTTGGNNNPSTGMISTNSHNNVTEVNMVSDNEYSEKE